MASQFLAHRRRRFPESAAVDQVLGIRVGHELDADLSRLADAGMWVRESFGISGLWSLCWIDGALMREARNATQRRARLVGALVEIGAMRPRTFLPVFDAGETIEGIENMLQGLRAAYPDVVSTTWFIDGRDRGFVDSRAAR